jgi:hypothetical protein
VRAGLLSAEHTHWERVKERRGHGARVERSGQEGKRQKSKGKRQKQTCEQSKPRAEDSGLSLELGTRNFLTLDLGIVDFGLPSKAKIKRQKRALR